MTKNINPEHKPEIFLYNGASIDAQAQLEAVMKSFDFTSFTPAAAAEVLLITQPRNYGRVNTLHIGTSTISTNYAVELFDVEAPRIWWAEIPAKYSDNQYVTDRQGRPRLDANGQPIKSSWFGYKALRAGYLPRATNVSPSGRVFADEQDPTCLYPGVTAFVTIEEAEAEMDLVRACVMHLRKVSQDQASGLLDIEPNVVDNMGYVEEAKAFAEVVLAPAS